MSLPENGEEAPERAGFNCCSKATLQTPVDDIASTLDRVCPRLGRRSGQLAGPHRVGAQRLRFGDSLASRGSRVRIRDRSFHRRAWCSKTDRASVDGRCDCGWAVVRAWFGVLRVDCVLLQVFDAGRVSRRLHSKSRKQIEQVGGCSVWASDFGFM